MGLLNDPHYKYTLHMTEVFGLTEFINVKIVVIIHIFSYNFQHEIKFTLDIVAFNDFIHFKNTFDEPLTRIPVVLF